MYPFFFNKYQSQVFRGWYCYDSKIKEKGKLLMSKYKITFITRNTFKPLIMGKNCGATVVLCYSCIQPLDISELYQFKYIQRLDTTTIWYHSYTVTRSLIMWLVGYKFRLVQFSVCFVRFKWAIQNATVQNFKPAGGRSLKRPPKHDIWKLLSQSH